MQACEETGGKSMSEGNNSQCHECGGFDGSHFDGCDRDGGGGYRGGSGGGLDWFKVSLALPIGFFLSAVLGSGLGVSSTGGLLFLLILCIIGVLVWLSRL